MKKNTRLVVKVGDLEKKILKFMVVIDYRVKMQIIYTYYNILFFLVKRGFGHLLTNYYLLSDVLFLNLFLDFQFKIAPDIEEGVGNACRRKCGASSTYETSER